MLALAGSLFAEISPAKLLLSWTMLFVVPALLLGLTPLIASAWLTLIKDKITSPLIGIWPILLLAVLAMVGLLGARSVLRMAESNFWSLNSLAIEPVYAICREGIRHLAGKLFQTRADSLRGARFHAVTSLAAGAVMTCAAAGAVILAWPATRWFATIADLASPYQLFSIALANGIVLVAAYLAIAALVWASADAAMPQPRDLSRPSSELARQTHMARRAPVGPSCGRRALWLSDRERTIRPARQRPSPPAPRPAGPDARQAIRSTSSWSRAI